MWITLKKLWKKCLKMNILKKAGYKMNLPFNADCNGLYFPVKIIYDNICRV